MVTKFVGIKEFRKNISAYAKRALKERTKFIIVNHNKPIFEILPFAMDATLDTLFSDILAAKKDVLAGRVYSHDKILAELS